MKKETKTLPDGTVVEITTRDDDTAVVEAKDPKGRLVEFQEFYTFEEADKFVAELGKTSDRRQHPMKTKTRKLAGGTEIVVTTRENTTAYVEVKDREGRVVELREFNSFEEADKCAVELESKSPKSDDLKKREERFQRMGLSEAEAEVAARGRA